MQVIARSNEEFSSVTGTLTVATPPGWKVEPNYVDLSLEKAGDTTSIRFKVFVPGDTPSGDYLLKYVVHSGGRDYDVFRYLRAGAVLTLDSRCQGHYRK